MKLADIPLGSDPCLWLRREQIAEQVEFELKTCRRLFAEPEKVLELLAKHAGLERLLRRRRAVIPICGCFAYTQSVSPPDRLNPKRRRK